MLKQTAERTLPLHDGQTDEDRLVYLKQVALYQVAAAYCAGKVVLDLGCGEGYGSAILAACAFQVIAADNSYAAVSHAARKYGGANISFIVCDAQHLPFRTDAFATLVSFEVVEHVPDVPGYLREARRVCFHTAIFSTPNRLLRLLPLQRPWNTFHLREYEYRGFAKVLARVFNQVNVLCLTARPDLLEIERRRVRQNPLVAYPRMLARALLPPALYLRAKQTAPRAKPKASEGSDTARVEASDYSLSATALREGITLVGICK